MANIEAILATHSLFDFLPYPVKEISEDRYRGRCPLCDSSNGLSVFKHRNGHHIFNCFSCNEKGSVIDLYAKLNKVTLYKALTILSPSENAPDLTIEQKLNKSADAYKLAQGKFVLCCVKCPTTREVKDDLTAAILCDGGSNWEVAPDGIAAVCPKCLAI